MLRCTSVMLVVLLGVTIGRAEIAPNYYRQMQDQAPEALVILPSRVTVKNVGDRQDVQVHCRIVRVIRTANGLKADQEIEIRYSRENQGRVVVGPSPIPLLKEKEEVPAYLTPAHQRGRFAPAAMGRSFEPLIEIGTTQPATQPSR